jgi:YVTN family beta-propeller protein
VTVIDCATDSVLANAPVGDAVALCYNSQNDKVYCANVGSNCVVVIDGASDTVITGVPVGSYPLGVCYNAHDNKVYCSNYVSGYLTVIDGASNLVLTKVASFSGPRDLCYDPQYNRVYSADYVGNAVTVIGGASDSVLARIAVGVEPVALCFNSAQNRVYVANYSSNSISVIQDSMTTALSQRPPLTGRHVSLEAYPNPFRGRLSLRLTANSSRPQVRVYDVNGALVRDFSPTRSLAPSLSRSLTWDGTDGTGRRVPAGVYVVRLTDGAESVSRKVLLLR